MMEYRENLFGYLEGCKDITFEEMPFQEIDGMILSRFSYEPFELVMQERDSHFRRLEEVALELLHCPRTEEEVLYSEDIKLLRILGESRRFGNLMIGNYVDLYDRKEEVQFSAISLRFEDGSCGIAYRGTDNTLVGWKEDLNMGFIFPIASQQYAREYLEELSQNTDGPIILMGHSKGGNLAAYAAIFCSEEVQRRIQGVYNYDGPGFDDSVLESGQYENICSRIHTFVPQASVVGMLLGHREEHRVVHSQEFRGPFQHNVYSWEVKENEFVYEQEVTKASRYLDYTMKEWMAHMDKEKRELFVEALYSLLSDTNAKTIKEMKNDWKGNSQLIIESMKNMDEGTRKQMREGISLFMKCAWGNIGKGEMFSIKNN